jgi:Trk K+ transport system NAD-binding subunit
VGKTIEEITAQRTFSLLIPAVRQPAGEMIVGVGADYRLSAKDVLIVLAKPENLERFRKHHGLGSRADVEHRL